MENAKISIIVPAYNIEAYLGRCLDSILAQTHTNLEIIVVDDGSSDGTLAIAKAYEKKDARLKVLHQENAGVMKAREAGLRHAAGEWFGFVDGDDSIEPDMYARLLGNAIKHRANISHCGYRMVFPDRVDYYYNTGCLEQQDTSTALAELLSGKRIEPGLCNKLFHRSLLSALFDSGVLDMGIRINEDLLMNYFLFKASGTGIYEDFCPYHYMVRNGSAAKSKSQYQLTDPITVFELILQDSAAQTSVFSIAMQRYIGILLHNIAQTDYPEVARDCRCKMKQPEIKAALKKSSKKTQLMALLILHFPHLYRLIRRIYNKITKADQKYFVPESNE